MNNLRVNNSLALNKNLRGGVQSSSSLSKSTDPHKLNYHGMLPTLGLT